jgi:glycerol-3-phosphate dehydrogenase
MLMNTLASRKWAREHIYQGGIIDSDQLAQEFPCVPTSGLRAGAVWYDARMRHPNRVLIETLLWACEHGAHAQNYVEVMDLVNSEGTAVGVSALDHESGRELQYRATAVINATGPSSRSFARRAHRDFPQLFRESVAWNVAFDRKPIGEGALAIKAHGAGEQTYFLHSRGEKLFVGTGHARCGTEYPAHFPSQADLDGFMSSINQALPSLELESADIDRVYSGLLPADAGERLRLSDRPIFLDHGTLNGPKHLYSVSGVKYTTARAVASRMIEHLKRVCPTNPASSSISYQTPRETRIDYRLADCVGNRAMAFRSIVESEAACHLDDLLLRRTDFCESSTISDEVVTDASHSFDWTPERRESEVRRFRSLWRALLAHKSEGRWWGGGRITSDGQKQYFPTQCQ